MVFQVMSENSNSVSKFLPLFIFPHNFKPDNNQINIYNCFANKQSDIFITLLKIAIKNKGLCHKYVLFVYFCFLQLFKEKPKRL